MNNLTFKPWIGASYGKPDSCFSKKILIIGESFYLTDENRNNSQDFCIGLFGQVIETRCKKWGTKFFQRLFYPLAGKRSYHASKEEWAAVWNSIAYNVYLQTTELSKSRQKTSQAAWDKAPAALLATIEECRPDAIIITSKGAYSHWNNYAYNNSNIPDLPVKGITHPSSRFRSQDVRMEIQDYFLKNGVESTFNK